MAVDSPRAWFAPTTAPAPPPPATGGAEVARRVPTGVADFDHLTGGVPTGSVILLIGEAGAGHQEFALTSAVHMMLHYDDPELHRFYLGSARGPFTYPRAVVYVSLTRTQEQVLREVELGFDPQYRDVLSRHLRFHDLSPAYFSDSVVPAGWASVPSALLDPGPTRPNVSSPLEAIANAFEADGASNLVVVDSLTDLFVRRGVDTEELLTLVKGLRRRAKAGDGLVYLLLSRGVAGVDREQALVDSVDGVLSFQWTSSPHQSFRRRTMLIERFLPVLPRIRLVLQGRFVILVCSASGLVSTQFERI